MLIKLYLRRVVIVVNVEQTMELFACVQRSNLRYEYLPILLVANIETFESRLIDLRKGVSHGRRRGTESERLVDAREVHGADVRTEVGGEVAMRILQGHERHGLCRVRIEIEDAIAFRCILDNIAATWIREKSTLQSYKVERRVGFAADEAHGRGQLEVLFEGVEIDRIYAIQSEATRDLHIRSSRWGEDMRGNSVGP